MLNGLSPRRCICCSFSINPMARMTLDCKNQDSRYIISGFMCVFIGAVSGVFRVPRPEQILFNSTGVQRNLTVYHLIGPEVEHLYEVG